MFASSALRRFRRLPFIFRYLSYEAHQFKTRQDNMVIMGFMERLMPGAIDLIQRAMASKTYPFSVS
jgi:hypothetical protein